MTDRIELRGLRALGHHGALVGEQDRPQPFEIDLDVEVDVTAAAASDQLPDTVNYGAVATAAVTVVTNERYHLLERLARRIGDAVLATDSRVSTVVVTVRKVRPPVPVDLGSVGVRLECRRQRTFLGLGSNIGERLATLRQAVAALPDVAAVSSVYETEPVGGPPDQPPYLNVVVELTTSRTPEELLEIAQRMETAAGRDRETEERNGPRPLDVDLLWIDGVTVDEPDLVLPHPRMFERRFVLAPLSELASDLLPPGWEQSAAGSVRRVGRL